MHMAALLQRIVVDPRIMVGKPVIRGTRLTVQYVLSLLAQGAGIDEIVAEYEGLTPEDIRACIAFAEAALESESFLPFTEAA